MTRRAPTRVHERNLEQLLQSITANAPDFIIRLDRAGTITYMNRPAPGKTDADMLGSDLRAWMEPPYRPAFERALADVFTTGQLQSYESAGSVTHRYYINRISPVLVDGKVDSAVLVTHDITDLRRAELALARTNRALAVLSATRRSLLRADDENDFLQQVCEALVASARYRLAWIGFAELDADQTVRAVAQRGFDDGYLEAMRITWADTPRGRGPTGTAIRTGQPAIAQRIRTNPRFAPWRAAAIERGYESSMALPLQHGDRVLGALNVYATEPDAFDGDEAALLRDVAADVSIGIATLRTRAAKNLAAAALRDSEQRFRALVEHAPEAIVVVDADTMRFVEANTNAAELLGLSREQLLAASPLRFAADGELRHDLERAMAGETEVLERQLRDAQGNLRTCEVRLLRLPSTDRRLLRGSITDITERKLLEQRALHSQKMDAIGQLAGGIAHDFNNQLAGILGYAGNLASKLEDGALRDNVLAIERAARRSADLTAKLLAFARRGQFRALEVDIHETIVDVVSMLEHSIDKRIKVRTRLTADDAIVSGDPTQLQSALLNLGINARDAMKDGGQLVFSTESVRGDDAHAVTHGRTTGDLLKICVVDTGIGIPAENQARVFEPFFTDKPHGEGTGMGLASVYGTVEAHAGHIELESAQGAGTTFTIYLPLASARHPRRAPAAATAAADPAEEHATGRVLVVDDERIVRDVVELLLLDQGLEVDAYEDPTQALDHFRSAWRATDLVILDIGLPHMSGGEVYRRMRDIDPDVRVLVSSGYSLEGEAQALLDAGAAGFLQKPFDADALVRNVLSIIGPTSPR